MDNSIEELLMKYVRRELNKTQTEMVEDWIRESEEHRSIALRYFRIEQYGRTLKKLSTTNEKTIREKAEKNVSSRCVLKNSSKRRLKWIAYAACAVSLISIGAFQIRKTEQLHALTCEQVANGTSPIVLEDGTRVWLNSNSRLLTPQQFKRRSRTVKLEGQAYFEVTHDARRPFTVCTEKGNVEVLGTSFDVISYPDAGTDFSTTLVSGKVKVSVVCAGVNHSATILPGQRFTFSPENQKFGVDEVDVEPLISWKEGRIVASHTPLKDVLSIISNTYGVRFVINNPEKLKDTCTGLFEKQDVEQILLTIEKVTGVNFKLTNDTSDGLRRYIVY